MSRNDIIIKNKNNIQVKQHLRTQLERQFLTGNRAKEMIQTATQRAIRMNNKKN